MAKLIWTSDGGALNANGHLPSLPVTQKFFILEIVECSYVLDSVLVKETVGGGGQIVVRK